jgi:RHS repeat-associated protein
LSTVTDASGAASYNYDAVGNLQNFSYPNGVTHAYSYDTLNRLTQMGTAKNAMGISNYAYTLGPAGNRLTVAELSGRSVNYGYDSLYRLTSEAVSNDPNNHDGTTSYVYDNVGNRKQLLANGVVANAYTYDADDRLGSDQYDADGNTVNSLGTANTYDFENHLTQHGYVTLVYDGDGNRVSETVGGVTTNYLVDVQNPTGYAQVVDELQSGTVTRAYSYGLERISESQTLNSTWTPSFYGYDGHGSVRQLTNLSGTVTDTYDYDAFGNLINSTGTTPNVYLFAGEQYDAALGLYYNRARYLNTTTGRFSSMDTDEGNDQDPISLHKYLYADANPVNGTDPTGNQDVIEEVGAEAIDETLDSIEFATNLAQPISAARRAVAFLTAAALIADAVAASFGAGGNDLTSPSDDQEVEINVYRDTKGTNPGEFSFTPATYPDTDKREISLLETPKRDKKYVVPFRVRFRLPKTPFFTVGGIVDPELIPLLLQVRYSPLTTPGHWSLLGNLYDTPDEQRTVKEALSAFAKNHAQPAN